MKTITKLIASTLFVAAISFGNKTYAQDMSSNMSSSMSTSSPWRFGIGVETGLPTGNTIAKYSRWMLGGTAKLQYNAAEHLGITLTSGYYSFMVNDFPAATTAIGGYTYLTQPHSLGVIPVKLGLKAFCTDGMYFSAEGGVGFETGYNQDKKLILSPGIGYSGSSIDVSARYENFSGQNNNYGVAAIRIAYGFGL